jgi:geranyl-CoA carboxylase alpha subunit
LGTVSFTKILVANRGEIACRVMRTAHRMGYRTVAVYSDADAQALHVHQADEAVHLGAAPASASYLNIAALIGAAKRTGADAVHPGYGFLSERADFAQACADAGLVFIGPSPAAITAMGNKARAKRRMLEAGVPCAPGYLGADQNDSTLMAQAPQVGLPLLVKAVAGGGGRGMRVVSDFAQMAEAIGSARREALSAFGDGDLMLERLIPGGRHIEVQVFADSQGNCIHLGERDCTTQRRRQKVIEETPSPIVSPAMRAAMGRDAVAAAQAVGYQGAGTVEFIVDPDLRHYFLEMNTRLQVEHPVTECITGLDLVEWQLRVAAGEPLPLTQEQVQFSGHAIEVRLYAEDPYDHWKPQTGHIAAWLPEQTAVRIDHGLSPGAEITPYYDAMVAKYIAHGHNRADAIRRLVRALEDAPLVGIVHNGRFLRDLLLSKSFSEATLTTTLLDEWAEAGHPLLQRPTPDEEAWHVAALALAGPSGNKPASVSAFDLSLVCQGQQRTVRLPLANAELLSHHNHTLRVSLGGVHKRFTAVLQGNTLHLAHGGGVFSFTEPAPYTAAPHAGNAGDASTAAAPVAGLVAQVLVQPGDSVAAGQALVCVEAMKMEMWLHAGAAGRVRAVHAAPKQAVAKGDVLVELELTE